MDIEEGRITRERVYIIKEKRQRKRKEMEPSCQLQWSFSPFSLLLNLSRTRERGAASSGGSRRGCVEAAEPRRSPFAIICLNQQQPLRISFFESFDLLKEKGSDIHLTRKKTFVLLLFVTLFNMFSFVKIKSRIQLMCIIFYPKCYTENCCLNHAKLLIVMN